MRPPRVAFFTDSYLEANGVARTSQALEAYASSRCLPFLCVHAGPHTRFNESGAIARLELRRGPVGFQIEHDMAFDLLLWRHYRAAERVLRRFAPDVLHFTGPSDVGQLGAYLGYRLGIPMVGSWHTNLHEYVSRRVVSHLAWLSDRSRDAVGFWLERGALATAMQFYRIPRALLAPNEELVRCLAVGTHKPTHLMSRGVDVQLFSPSLRDRSDDEIRIGYVGRLSAEKNVRMLAAVERTLVASGVTTYRFVIIGEGSERAWLEQHMTRAELPGVLRGPALARAYADMDLFVFPSETDTVGNVVLEAMASGVPVIAMTQGGPRFLVEAGVSGLLVSDERELADAVLALIRDRARRERMREAARARASTLSWDRIFDSVYNVYAQVSRS